MSQAEVIEEFDCFGSRCAVLVSGRARDRSARDAGQLARRTLLAWHGRFSRFIPGSELSLLNADPRTVVPVGALMARFAQTVRTAGSLSRGLVDATLLDEIESAGYVRDLHAALPLAIALELAPARRPARARAFPGWQQLEVDLAACTVTRAPGVRLDSGGLVKGLFADILAARLVSHPRYAINCAGDLALGGSEAALRPVKVESPFDGRTLHTFNLREGGVATSGIGRRSWLDRSGRPAHHLLDPASGRPAFTGIVQVTAIAPGALSAEIHAKAALLSGPSSAQGWLPHGGVIVYDDGSHRVIEPPPTVTLSELSAFAQRPRTPVAQAA